MQFSTDIVSSLLALVTAIFKSDALESLILAILDMWRSSRFQGTYVVESHHSILELKDDQGYITAYSKHQRMKFIQNNVFAVQDQVWGDGNIFADYQCSPGIVADIYKEGYRYKLLISLRSTKNKGDLEDLLIERMVENGFTTAVGNFQTQIDHPTKELLISVIFPASRPPKTLTLIEQNSQRSTILGQEHIQHLPDSRVKYSWGTKKARLYEGYILRWEW